MFGEPNNFVSGKSVQARAVPISLIGGLFLVLCLVAGLALKDASNATEGAFPQERLSITGAVNQTGQFSAETNYTWDRSLTSDSLLISKTRVRAGQELSGDLWLWDGAGKERLLEKSAVSARFAPDGGKIAYVNTGRELVIETVTGRVIARIPRASEPVWDAESATVSFSAVASLEYPDLQQSAIYDLKSGQIVDAKKKRE